MRRLQEFTLALGIVLCPAMMAAQACTRVPATQGEVQGENVTYENNGTQVTYFESDDHSVTRGNVTDLSTGDMVIANYWPRQGESHTGLRKSHQLIAGVEGNTTSHPMETDPWGTEQHTDRVYADNAIAAAHTACGH